MITPPSQVGSGDMQPCDKCGHTIPDHKSPKRDNDTGNFIAECTICNKKCIMSM